MLKYADKTGIVFLFDEAKLERIASAIPRTVEEAERFRCLMRDIGGNGVIVDNILITESEKLENIGIIPSYSLE